MDLVLRLLSVVVVLAVAQIVTASPERSALHSDEKLLKRFVDAREKSQQIHSRSKRQIWKMYPGTKWCGASNIAKHNNDFGWWRKADVCCKNHDKCDKNIEPGEYKYGVKNNGRIALSHCNCDSAFYNCLKAAKTWSAFGVGHIYFNVLRVDCITEGVTCTGDWWWRRRCKPTPNKMVIKKRQRSF